MKTIYGLCIIILNLSSCCSYQQINRLTFDDNKSKTIIKETYKYLNQYQVRSPILYRNPDGSKNVYKVDSITIDMNEYKIIMSKVTNQIFILPNNLWYTGDFSEDKILRSPSCYILGHFLDEMSLMFYLSPWYESPELDLIGDTYGYDIRNKWLKPDRLSIKNGNYSAYHFEIPPTYYYLLLIRGDVYNQLSHAWVDGLMMSLLDFPDYTSYYKVLCPVWENKFWLKEKNDN